MGSVSEGIDEAVFGVCFYPGPSNDEEYYLATAGGNRSSVYAVTKSKVELRQRYEDADDTECFYACCWTFVSESSCVVCAGLHGIAKIVDCESAMERPALIGHGNSINDLKVHSCSASLLLTASKDESIRLWNAESAECLAVFAGERGHRYEVLSLDVHASGRLFCSSGTDNTIKLWRLDTPNLLRALFEAKKDGVETKKNDENNRRPKVVSEQFPYFSTNEPHSNYVDCARFFGNLLVSKSTHDRVLLWAPDAHRDRRVYDLKDTQQQSATAPPGVVVIKDFPLPKAKLWFLRFGLHPTANLLAAGNDHGTVHLWNLDSEQPLAKFKHRDHTAVRQVAFSPDAHLLAFCCDDASVHVYDISNNIPTRSSTTSL